MITREDLLNVGFATSVDTMPTVTSDGLMRVSEVCRVLNVERHTVYKLIDCDVLPAIRINARVTRIPVEAVAKLLSDR